jgi:hypothetical protein
MSAGTANSLRQVRRTEDSFTQGKARVPGNFDARHKYDNTADKDSKWYSDDMHFEHSSPGMPAGHYKKQKKRASACARFKDAPCTRAANCYGRTITRKPSVLWGPMSHNESRSNRRLNVRPCMCPSMVSPIRKDGDPRGPMISRERKKKGRSSNARRPCQADAGLPRRVLCLML